MKNDKLTKRLTVRLSELHFGELREFAREQGFDSATVIRHLVARFVADRQRQWEAKFNREVLGKP